MHAQTRPQIYFRLKIWPQIWVLRAQFPIEWEILPIGPRFQVFLADFLLHMRQNGHNSISGQIFNPKFEIRMGHFLSTTNFGGTSAEIYAFLSEKRLS